MSTSLMASGSGQGDNLNAVLNASMPPAKDSLYQAVPLALESKARQCFGSQESGICSIPSGDEDSLSLLSEDRQSLASTGSQLSFASEVTEEWYHCDVGGDLYPLGLEENIALEAQGMRRFKSQDSGLGSMEFGSDDISTLSKEERSLALTDHFPQATPVKEKAWKKYLSAMSDRVARNKERAFKYRQQAVDKSNQWRFWDRVAMADQQNVRAAREKAIDRELDRLAGCDVKAATQDETALTFLIADVMRDKTKQASKPLGKTKLFQVAEGQFKRWEGCRAHVKTSLKLIDEKNADLLRQDISTQRIAEGLLDRLKKDNSNSTHVRAALGALSERKTVKRCIITWLKQQCADLDLDQKSDGRDKRSLKDFIDRLSDDTTLGWKYKSKAYDILGEDDCPHYTVRLTRIENGVLVTEL